MSDPNPTQYGPYSATHIPLHAKIALWLRDAAGKFTTDSRASSPQIFANSGASSLTGLIGGSIVSDGSADIYVANASGAPKKVLKAGDSFVYADNAVSYWGDGNDIGATWDGTRFVWSQAAANSEMRYGVDGAGIDQRWYGDTASAALVWDQSLDALTFEGVASVRGIRNSTNGATAITATRVLTLADAGGIFTVAQSSAYDIDLPSPTTGAGCRYLFQLVSPGAFNVTITVAGSAATYEGNLQIDAATTPATGSTITFASGAAGLGDYVEFISTGTGKYFVRASAAGAGGITVS